MSVTDQLTASLAPEGTAESSDFARHRPAAAAAGIGSCKRGLNDDLALFDAAAPKRGTRFAFLQP